MYNQKAALQHGRLFCFSAAIEFGADKRGRFTNFSASNVTAQYQILSKAVSILPVWPLNPLKSRPKWHVAPATGDLTPAGLTPFDLVLAMEGIPYQINYSVLMMTMPSAVCYCSTRLCFKWDKMLQGRWPVIFSGVSQHLCWGTQSWEVKAQEWEAPVFQVGCFVFSLVTTKAILPFPWFTAAAQVSKKCMCKMNLCGVELRALSCCWIRPLCAR